MLLFGIIGILVLFSPLAALFYDSSVKKEWKNGFLNIFYFLLIIIASSVLLKIFKLFFITTIPLLFLIFLSYKNIKKNK